MADFHLIDLLSQAPAVGHVLFELTEGDKLAWLGERGKLCSIEVRGLDDRRVYAFESALGLRCAFTIAGDDFVFFGDNTSYVVHS